jgi:hypothetical protein
MPHPQAIIIFLRWLDATADTDCWHEPTKTFGLSELYACGFLVHEDSEVVVIAALGKDVGLGQYRVTVRIPTSAITHRQYIPIPAP